MGKSSIKKKIKKSKSGTPVRRLRKITPAAKNNSSTPGVTPPGLNCAEELMRTGDFDEALAKAKAVFATLKPRQTAAYLQTCRFLAFALTQCDRPEEAREYVEYADSVRSNLLDFDFIMTIISAKLREYDATMDYAEKYFSAKKKLAGKKRFEPWEQSFHLEHQLLNAYGVALIEKGRPDDAEAAFRKAIANHKNFDSPYTNLAILLTSTGRSSEAREIVTQGIEHNPNSIELRKITGHVDKMATISVCMIVKNEEKFLPRCLESIKEVADEIILVDTGSEDNTLAIAEKYGCKVHHFPWRGDFSSARNESLRHATGDWIFIIDADEELPEGEALKLRFFTCQPDIKMIAISVFNKSLETGKVSSFLPSVRLFRRAYNLRYYGIVHNRLNIPAGLQPVRCNVHLHHYGYDLSKEKLDQKMQRTRALLDKQLAEKPDDIFANFNMAQLLFGYGHSHSDETSRLIVKHASRVIANPESKTTKYIGQRIMAFQQKAAALIDLRKYDEAEECCRAALREKENYLDAIMILGHICMDTRRDKQAEEYYYKYLDLQKNYRADDEVENIILRYLDSRHIAWFALGVLAHRNDKTDEAIRCYLKVLKHKNGFKDTYSRLGKLYLDKKEFDKSEEMFLRDIKANPDSVFGHFGIGEIYDLRGDKESALNYFAKAAALAEDNPQVIYRYGKTLFQLHQYEKAAEQLGIIADIAPNDFKLNFEGGNMVFEIGKFDIAAKLYRTALISDPNHVKAMNNLGNCHFKMERFDKACDIYEQIIENEPDCTPVYRNLGIALARLQRHAEALNYLKLYSDKLPEDIEIMRVIGDLYLADKCFREAIPVYERYLQRHPDDYVCLYNFSEAYLGLGSSEAALAGYHQVLRIKPDFAPAQKRITELMPVANA